jgi:hypothetical protein
MAQHYGDSTAMGNSTTTNNGTYGIVMARPGLLLDSICHALQNRHGMATPR